MPFLQKLACSTLVLLCCGAAGAQSAGNLPVTRFPVVVSYNLEKAKVTLPTDLQGEVNFLILPFELEQQKEADTWTPLVEEVEATRPGLRHYLIPVYWRENFLYRWWMTSSLRSHLPAGEQRQSTIPLYLNRQQFLKQLQIPSDREITVLLVERDGRVLWRASGPMTEAKKASLEKELITSGSSAHPDSVSSLH